MAKILVVEDDLANQSLIERFLRLCGYDVICAGDGAKALALARNERPDLIIMDMGLPILDGWAATRRLKSLPATRDIPIIALTAYALVGDREKCLAAGCDEYESKPLDTERLYEKIRNLLG